MRFVTALIAALAVCLTIAVPASAGDIPTHSRTIAWRVAEPCDVEVATGEVKLEWSDGGGAYAVASWGDAKNSSVLLFVVGCPDMSKLDGPAAQVWCNRDCCEKQSDSYCGNCCPCEWKLTCGCVAQCCEEVRVYAWLPDCNTWQITNVY